MKIVYLDQNKWIELARAVKHPVLYPDLRGLLEALACEVGAGRLAVPLSSTNLYETYKIRDAKRRQELARVQAALSRGLVFRGRYRRLEEEVSDVLRAAYGLPAVDRTPTWFLSDVFFEATAEIGDPRLGVAVSDTFIQAIRHRPALCLYDYLVSGSEAEREATVRQFSEGSAQLKKRIEGRRDRHRESPISERRRIYGAILLIEEMDLIFSFATKAGIPWKTPRDLGPSTTRKIVIDVPVYDTERELTLRLESQARPIHENDMRDMQSFCTAIPYSDVVVGENQFMNLARQAKLDKKYATRLTTNLQDLWAMLELTS